MTNPMVDVVVVGASHHRMITLLEEFGLRRYPPLTTANGCSTGTGLAAADQMRELLGNKVAG